MRFLHVKGHARIEWNERADRLANLGVTGVRSAKGGDRPQSQPGPSAPLPINCSMALGSTVHDTVPIRASFAVMDHVASLAQNKSFVEIGSRHGDLIDCVSRVSRRAVSMEADEAPCEPRGEGRKAICSKPLRVAPRGRGSGASAGTIPHATAGCASLDLT